MRATFLTTLRFKIAVFVTTLLLITATVFSLLTIQTMNRHILEEVLKKAESLCKSTAALAPYSILSQDLLGIDNIVSKVKEANPDVEYVVVVDDRMKVLDHTDVSKRGSLFRLSPAATVKEDADGTRIADVHTGEAGLFEISTPVVFGGKLIGHIVMGVNKSVLLDAQAESRRRMLAGLAIIMLLGAGCIVVLSSLVTKPLKELSRGVRELREGRRAKLRIFSHDELGSLTASFNRMADMITKQQTELGSSARELEEAYVSTVKVLSAAIDARDPYTLGHSTRVAKLAVKIGRAYGLSHRDLEELEVASLFHDVGKLKTPDYVLHKDGPLNPLELHEMAEHSEHGAAILSRAPSLQKYVPAVRHHHEWYNGEGYPDGLRGEDIPLHAAIIAVADAFDAMTSSRPYKNPRTDEDALRELTRFAGRQFDPRIIGVFHLVMNAPTPLADRMPEEDVPSLS